MGGGGAVEVAPGRPQAPEQHRPRRPRGPSGDIGPDLAEGVR